MDNGWQLSGNFCVVDKQHHIFKHRSSIKKDSDNALFNDPKDDDDNDDDLFVDPIQRTMHPLDGPTLRRLV